MLIIKHHMTRQSKITTIFVVLMFFFIHHSNVSAQTSELILDLNFNNDTSPNIVDSSTYGNNGTLSGATPSTDCIKGSCY